MGKVILGRVGMSVLLFETDQCCPPFQVKKGTQVYALDRLLCFIKTAPSLVVYEKEGIEKNKTIDAIKKVFESAEILVKNIEELNFLPNAYRFIEPDKIQKINYFIENINRISPNSVNINYTNKNRIVIHQKIVIGPFGEKIKYAAYYDDKKKPHFSIDQIMPMVETLISF